MSNLDILNQEEIKEFENPPIFSFQQQRVFFDIPHWLKIKLRDLDSPVNQVGFLLQLGYFRACGRFFKLATFRQSDIRHACRTLKFKLEQIDLTNYSYTSMNRHSYLILTELGFHSFSGLYKSLAVQETKYLVTKQISPSSIFRSLCDFIRTHSIEIPAYHMLATLITQTIRTSEKNLLETIQTQLNSQQKTALDSLFDKLPDDTMGRHTYKISRYKSLTELMKLSAIRSNMNSLKELKELYYLLISLINSLHLSEELIEYYAQYVLAADVFQIKQRNQKYLLLICFIKYQYLAINDVMVQTFMSTTQQTLRQSDNRKNELLLAWQEANQISQEQILLAVLAEAPLIKLLQDTAFSFDKTLEEKCKIMIEIIKDPQHDEFLKIVPSVEKLYHESTKSLEKKLLYDAMAEKSRAFQNPVAEMLRHLEFTATQPDDKIMTALNFYQKKHGDLTPNAPMEFLNKEEKERIKEGKNSFNEPLYKILLAKYIHKSLKSGRMNVQVSHQFKAFEDYMISQEDWSINHESLLARAGINHLKDWEPIQKILEDKLTMQFNETFESINKGANPFVKKRKNNTLQFITPKKKTQTSSIELYSSELYVTIFEVLHTVNEHTGFTKKLTHKMEEYRRAIMPNVINFASIISWVGRPMPV